MKKIFTLLLAAILFVACNNTKNYNSSDLSGKSFKPDGWHTVDLKSSSSYYIVQNYSCGGDGSWSVSNNIIKLRYNDSRCESTQNLAGNSYKITNVRNNWIEVTKL
tara:strand:- start:285 stop:602 length:318 start_codon:yes stop_codon:yes gene_type:complete